MTPKSILVIDDSRTIRQLLKQTLTSASFESTSAEDGVIGVEAFKQARFDAVITDINMPNLDGFGVIQKIRSGDHNQKVPILVLTTENSTDFKKRARELGATGWIVKPFEDKQLVDVLNLVTGRDSE